MAKPGPVRPVGPAHIGPAHFPKPSSSPCWGTYLFYTLGHNAKMIQGKATARSTWIYYP